MGSLFGVAVFALGPDGGEALLKFAIGELFVAEPGLEVGSFCGEEAGVEGAVGGDAGAVAAGAKGGRNRGDEAEFGAALCVSVALGDFTGIVGIDRLEVEVGGEDLENFATRDDVFEVPSVFCSDVHELDVAESEFGVAGGSGEGEDFTFVDATADNAVDLDGEASGLGGAGGLPSVGGVDLTSGHFARAFGGGGVEADVEAVETGGFEGRKERFEPRCIRRHREVSTGEGDADLANEVNDVSAQEGFSAGDADFVDAEGAKGVGEAGDFLEAEDFVAGEKLEAFTKDLCGHAILTAQIAAVGDGDAEVA